jgi:hypothetical protein
VMALIFVVVLLVLCGCRLKLDPKDPLGPM